MSLPSSQFQGVLWKRRDVFKNRWRPRWFVLDASAGLLTYYLDTNDNGIYNNNNNNNVHYDVVPRGTIYLRSCHVELDDLLSRPDENLYALVITPPPSANGAPCFLAAKSPQERMEWIHQLGQVCRVQDEQDSDDGGSLPSTQPTVLQTEGSVVPQEEPVVESWRNLQQEDETNNLTANLSPQLASHIQNTLETNLPLVSTHNDKHGWKLLFDNRNGVTAYERKLNSVRTMLKSTTLLENHSPQQILNLLLDTKRRHEFETNIQEDARLKQYNPHTFLDYYSYRPVWPTSARDFVAVVHWRVLEKTKQTTSNPENDLVDTDKAIIVLGFSWSNEESLQLKPLVPSHVRGDLLVSLYLLEDIRKDGRAQCRVTRVLSYDLGGNLPRSLANNVLQQQATMPFVLGQHLAQTEPVMEERLLGPLSHADIIKNVIDPLCTRNQDNDDALQRPQQQQRQDEFTQGRTKSIIVDKSTAEKEQESLDEPSTLIVAIWLLTPLVLWQTLSLLNIPGKEVVFVLSAWLALRTNVLAHAGRPYGSTNTNVVGQVTCRFTVDLKGVLRFIAATKQEEEKENDVSVIPIIVKATAQAMSQVPAFSCKRVYQPWLGIDGLYTSPKHEKINVSVLSTRHTEATTSTGNAIAQDDVLVTIQDPASMTIPEIAHDFARKIKQQPSQKDDNLGRCLVVLSSPTDSDQDCQVDMDVVPSMDKNVTVVVVVGRVCLFENDSAMPRQRTSTHAKKKPVLSMSITINCPGGNNSVATCRQFAEQVQKLLQFPEMCEE